MPRQRNYAAEYQARKARAATLGVTYSQARALRALFPLPSRSRAELRRNHQNMGQMHTRYAITRGRIAMAAEGQGQKLTRTQQRALAVDAPILRAPGNTTTELAQWYQQAWGNHYNPSDFPGVPVTGAAAAPVLLPGVTPRQMAEFEDIYDTGWPEDIDWEVIELEPWPNTE